MIKAILACDDEGGVSRNGTLPWPHNKTDLQWFKENTLDDVVIMGSTTWKDPHMLRPLPKRVNGVVTSNITVHKEGKTQPDFYLNGELIEKIKEVDYAYPDKTVWIIGGPNIISQTLDIIEQFYISRIPGTYECDTFLPLADIEERFDIIYTKQTPDVLFQIWHKKK